MPTCLVIDESSIVAKVATRILAGLDLQTVAASTVPDAVRALAEPTVAAPTLILVSASLQGTTVDASVKALRANPKTAKAKILVSLIDSNLGTMTRAKRAGADAFIFRPFDRASLIAWVEPFLEAKEPVAA